MTVWYAGAYAPAYQTEWHHITRSFIVSMRPLAYVTMCTWLSGKQEHMLLHTRVTSYYTVIYCINATPGLCHYVYMTVWYAGAYAPAYQTEWHHITRSFIVSMRPLAYVTMCTWLSGMQDHMLLHTRQSDIILHGHLHRLTSFQTVSYTVWHHARRSPTQSDIITDSHLQGVTSYRAVIYTGWHHTRRSSTRSDINQVSRWYNKSPDDGHMAARNM